MQAKLQTLEQPSRTTRFQEARYRITPAGRACTKHDSNMQQFLLCVQCCHDVKDGGHKPDCKGVSIGEMKDMLHDAERDYLRDQIDYGKGRARDPLWKEAIKLHNKICGDIKHFIEVALYDFSRYPGNRGPLIERV